jgi:hypothetical protein
MLTVSVRNTLDTPSYIRQYTVTPTFWMHPPVLGNILSPSTFLLIMSVRQELHDLAAEPGHKGERGDAARDGAPGATGFPGLLGPRGVKGHKGKIGLRGLPGTDGTTGPKGKKKHF